MWYHLLLCNLILQEDGNPSKLIPPFSVYMGKGTAVEIKECSKYYICFSKTIDGEVKNWFSMLVEQLPTPKKVVDLST